MFSWWEISSSLNKIRTEDALWTGEHHFLQEYMCAQAKTQISLRICAVWSESLQSSLCVVKDPNRLQMDNETQISTWGCADWSESSLGAYSVFLETMYPAAYTYIVKVALTCYRGNNVWIYRPAPCENVSSGICRQRRSRVDCTDTRSDQGLHCLLTDLLDITERMNGEQRPGRVFTHVQDAVNWNILRMFKGTFSLDAT